MKFNFEQLLFEAFLCDAYFLQHSAINAKFCIFYINSDVNSSANDPGASIFVIIHAEESLN